MNNQDDQQNETRTRILEAALETIFEEKISGSPISLIAEKANVSKGHLNYYFATKQELLTNLLDYLLQKFLEDRETNLATPDTPTTEKFDTFYEQKVRFIEEKKFPFVLYDFWVQATVNDSLRDKLCVSYSNWRNDINGVIDEGYNSGAFTAEKKELFAPFLVSILEGATIQYMIDPEAFDLDAFFEFSKTIIEKALTE